jgi:superfamily II DNA or RNA helicase
MSKSRKQFDRTIFHESKVFNVKKMISKFHRETDFKKLQYDREIFDECHHLSHASEALPP